MSQKSKNKNKRALPGAPKPALELHEAAPLKPRATAVAVPLDDEREPTADSSAMPAWLFVLMILMLYWGMLHLDRYAGGFNEKVFGPYESFRQLADLQPKSGPQMLIAKGESIYGVVCVACHQGSGMGSPGQYPPLVGSDWVIGSPERLIRIPLHGLTGPIEVNGKPWTGSMPAFGGAPPLDDDENLAAVLSYIRAAWGNDAPPISPEQVANVRAETASRTTQWTAAELQSVGP